MNCSVLSSKFVHFVGSRVDNEKDKPNLPTKNTAKKIYLQFSFFYRPVYKTKGAGVTPC